MRRLVGVLGVLAVLSVLGAAAMAALDTRRHRPADGRQWLRAYGVEVAVPASRWRLTDQAEAITYGTGATVNAPAVLDAGFCPSSRSSSRAFVGLLPPQGGSLRDVIETNALRWASSIAQERRARVVVPRARVELDIAVKAGPCAPTAVHLTVVGRQTPDGVVTLILVRDVGEPGDLSPAAAEGIVESLRSSD